MAQRSKSPYSKSVLLVDDNPQDRQLFARLLAKKGFDVLSTHSADSALAAVVHGNVGCVVLDQRMPVSGAEVARMTQNTRSDVGIVFVSGSPPDADILHNAVFVSKDDRHGIIEAVERCMVRWRSRVS
jgi:CheY-like chemotaxis protein